MKQFLAPMEGDEYEGSARLDIEKAQGLHKRFNFLKLNVDAS